MADSEALEVLRESLEADLRELLGTVKTDADGDFVVRAGSAAVWVRPVDWVDGQTLVRVWSYTNVDVPIDGGLAEFLAEENGKLPFCRFELHQDTRTVALSHTLLGDFLNRAELEEAVGAVAVTADMYDDRIRERFGGRLRHDTASREPIRTTATTVASIGPDDRRKRTIQAIFGALGLTGAIAGAIFAADTSVWLSVFVAVMALQIIGRAIPDVITDPNRIPRALYFLLLPGLATAILIGAHAAWDTWWLAFVLAVLGGAMLTSILAPLLFPNIHREEEADTAQRIGRQVGLA
jgi:hypothetical protein